MASCRSSVSLLLLALLIGLASGHGGGRGGRGGRGGFGGRGRNRGNFTLAANLTSSTATINGRSRLVLYYVNQTSDYNLWYEVRVNVSSGDVPVQALVKASGSTVLNLTKATWTQKGGCTGNCYFARGGFVNISTLSYGGSTYLATVIAMSQAPASYSNVVTSTSAPAGLVSGPFAFFNTTCNGTAGNHTHAGGRGRH